MKSEILHKAIDKLGTKNQIAMIQEEATELALAVHKYLNRSETDKVKLRNDLIDELADMKIMLAQAEIIMGKKDIENRVSFKMQRLANRLK
jgi:NTP pyrophosphatase (non-canonical NTP hydrolase)